MPALKDGKTSGVYAIWNSVSKKFYVGSGVSIGDRRRSHFGGLRKGTHFNRYLQNAYNKHGEKVFKFIILEKCERERLLEREQHWINMLKASDRNQGYNLRPLASSNRGVKLSPETKAKIAASKIGKKRPDYVVEKMRQIASEQMRGEHKERMRQSHLGKPLSDETKQKISKALTGQKRAPETGRLISQKLKGKKASEETREKMRLAKTPEIRAAMSARMTGRKVSDETRAKLSARMKARRAAEAAKATIPEGNHFLLGIPAVL